MQRSLAAHLLTIALPLLLVTLCAGPVEAQKLKLPNFLPFKKQNAEVPPVQMSDRGQTNQNRSLMDLLNRKNRQPKQAPALDWSAPENPETKGPLAEFNVRSKEFFSKAGEGFSRFAGNTRTALDDLLNPPKTKQAWWNQDPQTDIPLPKFDWSKVRHPEVQPIAPRTANQYQTGQPRHRFR